MGRRNTYRGYIPSITLLLIVLGILLVVCCDLSAGHQQQPQKKKNNDNHHGMGSNDKVQSTEQKQILQKIKNLNQAKQQQQHQDQQNEEVEVVTGSINRKQQQQEEYQPIQQKNKHKKQQPQQQLKQDPSESLKSRKQQQQQQVKNIKTSRNSDFEDSDDEEVTIQYEIKDVDPQQLQFIGQLIQGLTTKKFEDDEDNDNGYLDSDGETREENEAKEDNDEITESDAIFLSVDELSKRLEGGGGDLLTEINKMVNEAKQNKQQQQLQKEEDKKIDLIGELFKHIGGGAKRVTVDGNVVNIDDREPVLHSMNPSDVIRKLVPGVENFIFDSSQPASSNNNNNNNNVELAGHDEFIQGQRRRGYVLQSATVTSGGAMTTTPNQLSMTSQGRDTFQYIGGDDIDMERALILLTESANKGNHKAMYVLGTIEEVGEMGLINFTRAAEWFKRSAELGNSDAQLALAFLYSTGKGVEMDESKAILYYTFAAKAGNTVAKLSLAYRYFFGYGTSKSCFKAAILYEDVARRVVEDIDKRGFGYQIETEKFSDEQQYQKSSQAEEESVVDYFKYSASLGDAGALVTMANLHLQGGLGVDQDVREAFRYYHEASKLDSASGVAGMAFMYAKGYGVPQDNKTAAHYYEKAAKMGHYGAQSNLAEMYLNGWGVEKNPAKAIKLFRDAEENGDVDAKINLGKLYQYGHYVERDVMRALTLFQQAAMQGNPAAIYHQAALGLSQSPSLTICNVAVANLKKVAERGPWAQILTLAHQLYDEGDEERSLLFFEKAAEMGIDSAQNNAAWMYDNGLGIGGLQNQDEEQQVEGEVQPNEDELNNNHDNIKEIIDSLAFRYYLHSSEQNNPQAHVKLGDYYYYGKGGEVVDKERAAEQYQKAANLQNSQALFNLGYMHQFGNGRPQDLFLAKRYYDMALTHQPNAYIPVYIALVGLLGQFIYKYILSILNGTVNPFLDNSSLTNDNDHELFGSSDIHDHVPPQVEGNDIDPSSSFNDEYIKRTAAEKSLLSFDSYIIFIVAIIFGYLVIRRQRIILRQRRPQQQQQQNQPN